MRILNARNREIGVRAKTTMHDKSFFFDPELLHEGRRSTRAPLGVKEIFHHTQSHTEKGSDMLNKNVTILCASAVAVATCVAGCAGIKREIEETKARGTIESGGYTWTIPADSEGGNTIKTHGLPSRQAATDVSSKLCKKYGRVAQYVDQRGIFLTGAMIFDFNCVR